MERSNIVVGSNVFVSHENDPRMDKDFVAQIRDSTRLEGIKKRHEVDERICLLSRLQMSITHREKRCVYAKDDPCWGYSDSEKKVVCACVNKSCRHIYECNPNFKGKDAEIWSIKESEINLYGNPRNLSRYYKVDMVSDEEMNMYFFSMEYEGWLSMIKKNEVTEKKEKIHKVNNPRYTHSGRKLIVIGYQRKLDNLGSYEGEELLPIWGCGDEMKMNWEIMKYRELMSNKAAPIQKKKEKLKKNLPNTIEDEDVKKYEQIVNDNISDEIKLAELNEGSLHNKTIVILDNPAERAIVSSSFITKGIKHGFEANSYVRLINIEDYSGGDDFCDVLISEESLKKGCGSSCLTAWRNLSRNKNIYKFCIPKREYRDFKYNGKSRWCCRNLYGITHIEIRDIDLKFTSKVDVDSLIKLEKMEESYKIFTNASDEIGETTEEFTDLIDSLLNSDEIPTQPILITGISVEVRDGKTVVYGMGNLKFDIY